MDGSILEWLVRAKAIDAPTRHSLIREALALGADPHRIVGIKRNTAFQAAREVGDQQVRTLILDVCGPPPVPATLEGAVELNDLEAVERLLADPRTTAAAHRALVVAIETNRFDILRYFLRHNAGIEAPPGERSALHAAAAMHDVGLILQLLDKGAPVDAVDEADRKLTPLRLTATLGVFRLESFVTLFKKSPPTADDITGDDWEWLWPMLPWDIVHFLAKQFSSGLTTKRWKITLLHVAAAAGDDRTVTMLLASGADPLAKTAKRLLFHDRPVKKGATPLDVARALGRMHIVMTLAAAAAEPASEAAARPTKKAASPKRRR